MAAMAFARDIPIAASGRPRWRHVADAALDLPPSESWRSVMDRICLPYVETRGELAAPRGQVLWMASESGAEFTRVDATPQKIAGRYPQQSTGVWLSALIEGEAEVEVEGESFDASPGAVLFGPTGAAASVDYHTPFRQLFVKLPKAVIHPRLLSPAGLKVGRLDPELGSTRMLFALLKAAAANLDELSPEQLRPVEMAVTEFLVSCLADQGGASARGGAAGARASQLNRIRQTIEARLSDAEVSLEDIAAAHRISPRYLQKLFKSADETFSHYILARRLERCRSDLANPQCAQLSISQICFRWGFNGSPHFSRAFRDRFGLSPREHRRASLPAPTEPAVEPTGV
jgi:AraC-like DNA-binding protein